jgi:hypothetical protein
MMTRPTAASITTTGNPGIFSLFFQSVFSPRQGWLAGVLFLMVLCTRGYYLGDTPGYVREITTYFHKSPVGPGNMLWEFGHLLWRPLGWIMVGVAAPVVTPLTGWEPAMICSLALVGLNMIFGFLTVLLWHSMALEIVASRLIAFLIAAGFACANSFLTYLHSGMSYLPGLFFVTLSLWLVRRSGGRSVKPSQVAASAIALALAALLWFPYVLSAPGILLAVVRPNAMAPLAAYPKSGAIRLAMRFVVILLLCLFIGYGAGAWARNIRSVAETRSWVTSAEHSWAQTQRVMRLATGIPRSFL